MTHFLTVGAACGIIALLVHTLRIGQIQAQQRRMLRDIVQAGEETARTLDEPGACREMAVVLDIASAIRRWNRCILERADVDPAVRLALLRDPGVGHTEERE